TVAALEAAHEAVLEAEERAERRLAGRGARQRLEQARAAEQELLDRLGLPSYSSYRLRTSTVGVDPGAPLRLSQARVSVGEAEAALGELRALGDALADVGVDAGPDPVAAADAWLAR